MVNRFYFLLMTLAIILICSASMAQVEKYTDGKHEKEKSGDINDTEINSLQNESVYKKIEEKKPEEIKKEDKRFDIGLSGNIYMEWVHMAGYQYSGSGDVPKVWKNSSHTVNIVYFPTYGFIPISSFKNEQSSLTNNTFRLQRVYLTFQKEINDVFSARITTDINTWNADKTNLLFMKFAWLQAKKEFGPAGVILRAGLVETPVIGYVDRVSDYRWISQSYIENSKMVLNGNSFDNSADFGVSVSLELFKMIKALYSYTNGEGYKNNNNETYKGKAHTILLTFAPVKELNVNFFSRLEDTDKKNFEEPLFTAAVIKYFSFAYRVYNGTGISFNNDLIKAGSNFVLLRNMVQGAYVIYMSSTTTNPPISSAPKHKKHFVLSDSWLNFNLGALVPDAPLLLAGRFVYGKEYPAMTANKMKTTTTMVKSVGLGWEFNSSVRIMGYYEHITYRICQKQKGVIVDNNIYPDLGTYVGYNRNPKAANNFYVKAEVKF